MNAFIGVILFILLCIFSLLSYFTTRIRGCGDKGAINYNPLINIADRDTCIYEKKGCMDPKFVNYNSSATVSCRSDCSHCGPYKDDKDKFFKDRVDCKYCKNTKYYRGITPSVSNTDCRPDQRCKTVIKGCNQPWGYNYSENSNLDDGSCINKATFEENLVAYSSQKDAIVSFRDEIIFRTDDKQTDPGLNVLVFDRDSLRVIKKGRFNVTEDYEEISRMSTFLRNINIDEIVLIISNGFAFELFNSLNQPLTDLFSEFERLGGKERVFPPKSNYILIGTKREDKDIYYEELSDEPVYFPRINITEKVCHRNPGNIYPINDDVFFRGGESFFHDGMKKRCALEASKRGTKFFGLTRNRCVVMNESEYNRLKMMEKSKDCLDGVGDLEHIAGFKFEKEVSNFDEIRKRVDGVYIYENENLSGEELLLTDHYYGSNYRLDRIKSLRIPDGVIVYLIDTRNNLNTLVGPNSVSNVERLREDYNVTVQELVIETINEDSVVFCDSFDPKKNRCFIKGVGKHRLDPYLFLEIKYIKPSKNTKRVTLHDDLNFSSIIHIAEGPEESVVELPRTIRSITIE